MDIHLIDCIYKFKLCVMYVDLLYIVFVHAKRVRLKNVFLIIIILKFYQLKRVH